MPTPLSDQTRSIVSACVPALEAHGLAITQEMYKRLLTHDAIRDLFNMSHQKDGEQPKALAFSVLAYARHIDNPAPLQGMIERIAEKHVGLNILPEHYPFVGEALLGAIAHVLGDGATPEIMNAWKEAYWFLADVLIEREQRLYQEHADQEGGWIGWRSFQVAERHEETRSVTSFILRPTDGKAVMAHKPGQYLSFRVTVPGVGSERRNYSISSAPATDHYRITVKRHDDGVVSRWLHDTVREGDTLDVSAPAGDFYLRDDTSRPICLISLGVGLTPMISILESYSARSTVPSVHYVHGTHNAQSEVFGDIVRSLARKGAIKADIFYSQEAPHHEQSPVCIHKGHVSSEWLTKSLNPEADIYLCGPARFMKDTITALREAGFPQERIHYDIFGSASDPFLATAA